MEQEQNETFTAFAGQRLLVSGDVHTMLRATKARLDAGETDPVLIFEDRTGAQIDFDFSGTLDDVLTNVARHPLFVANEKTELTRGGPGRPRLGVVCREISLLPRHWDWLAEQPGGASVTLRKLVEEARIRNKGKDQARVARDAAAKFMWVMAGDLPNFEEASRALFGGMSERLAELIRDWPDDIRAHLARLVERARLLEEEATAPTAGATTHKP